MPYNAFSRSILAPGLALLMLLPLGAAGQANSRLKKETFWGKTQKYGFGLRVGPSYSMQTVTDPILKKDFRSWPRSGFYMGGVVTMPLKLEYSFIAELGYQRTGRTYQAVETGWFQNFRYDLLTASMALRRSVNDIFKRELTEDVFISIGPSISWLAGSGGKIITPNKNVTPFDIKMSNMNPIRWDSTAGGDLDRYFINRPNRWLFGMDIGLGADIPITTRQTIYAELRFNWGHTTLGDRQTTTRFNLLNFEDTMSVNLKTISLTGIYTFTYDVRRSKQGKSTMKRPAYKRRRR